MKDLNITQNLERCSYCGGIFYKKGIFVYRISLRAELGNDTVRWDFLKGLSFIGNGNGGWDKNHKNK